MARNELIIDVIDMENVSKTRMENVLYNLQRSAISSYSNCEDKEEQLSDLKDEQNAQLKIVTDIIVLLNVNRYIFHHIFKRDWVKYYFSSISKSMYPNDSRVLFNIVLTRWPFVQMQTFPNDDRESGVPITHIIDLKIPLGDVPVRSTYEENIDVNISNITLVVSALSKRFDISLQQEHVAKLSKIGEINPNVFYFYGKEADAIKVDIIETEHTEGNTTSIVTLEDVTTLNIEPTHSKDFEEVDDFEISVQHQPQIDIQKMMYTCEGWKLENSTEERGINKYLFCLTI